MERNEAEQALAILRQVVSQARDDTVLQNWGIIWIVHGFSNGGGFIATNLLLWAGVERPWIYAAMWLGIVVFNITTIFLLKSQTAGARSFIENQIWLIWLSFIGGVAVTAVVNHLMGMRLFSLGPVIAILSAIGFASMGGVMGRRWFAGAVVFASAALLMAAAPRWQFIILGAVWGVGQIVAGIYLHVEKRRRLAAGPAPRLV